MSLKKEIFKKNCPDNEIFIKVFLKEASLEEKERLIDHILVCEKCRLKFEVMKQLSGELRNFEKDIEQKELSASEEREFRRIAKQRIIELEKGLKKGEKKTFFRSIPVRYLAVGAGALFIVVLGYWLLSKFRQEETYRVSKEDAFRLIEPVGKISEPPAVFIWTALDRADEYKFKLVDDELNILLDTKTYEAELILPEDVRRKLQKGKAYIWKIEAFDAHGRKLGSNMKHFKIK